MGQSETEINNLFFRQSCLLHRPSSPWTGLSSQMEEKSRGRSPGAPGAEVPVTVFRDGERVDVTLSLSERGAAAQSEETDIGAAADGELMGITISPVPELVRRNLGLQEGEAIMVQNVQPAPRRPKPVCCRAT